MTETNFELAAEDVVDSSPFTVDKYKSMFSVASSAVSFHILTLFDGDSTLTQKDVEDGMEGNDIDERIEQLVGVNLLERTDTGEYNRTQYGDTVVFEGVSDGVYGLATAET